MLKQNNRLASARDGSSFRAHFALKLHLAFGAMLLATLALAWYFYDSVEWYEHDLQRIALHNNILDSYQTLASDTWRMLGDMRAAVSAGEGFDDGDWLKVSASLEQAGAEIRRDIVAGVAFSGTDNSAGELKRLDEIYEVVSAFVEAGKQTSEALAEGQTGPAEQTVSRLRTDGMVTLFGQMIDSVIAEQQDIVRRAHSGAIGLAGYIVQLLPILMTGLIIVTLYLAWLFSRRVTHSVKALHDGALAFKTGNLLYRIPELKEVEFKRLAEGFNTMAHELSAHRANLDEARVKLESIVEERTRALRSSNERLAAIDDNRRQLLADISHEFRTPLTVIQGEAEIALRGDGKSLEGYRESLQRVLDQSRQTTRLVDDLLFIARAEVGEPRLDRAEVSVAELLKSVCDDFSARAENENTSIHLQLAQDEPILFADSGRLRQVFSTLMDNALKYSGGKGTISVELQSDPEKVTIKVSDRGIGLSEEELPHVFERYYRSKGAEDHETGSGLGLPVAKAIVEAHDGSIELMPRKGGGITCSVYLPGNQPDDQPS